MVTPAPALRTEIVAGVTTFLTMAYVVVVNPAILATEGTGLSFPAVMTATVVLTVAMTLLMGLYARLPFGVARGMGINAFFTFGIPLTFSITQGILWAFLAHVVLYVLAGRRAEVARGTWALAAIAATLIVVERFT